MHYKSRYNKSIIKMLNYSKSSKYSSFKLSIWKKYPKPKPKTCFSKKFIPSLTLLTHLRCCFFLVSLILIGILLANRLLYVILIIDYTYVIYVLTYFELG